MKIINDMTQTAVINLQEKMIQFHPRLVVYEKKHLQRLAEYFKKNKHLLNQLPPVVMHLSKGRYTLVSEYITYYLHIQLGAQTINAKIITDNNKSMIDHAIECEMIKIETIYFKEKEKTLLLPLEGDEAGGLSGPAPSTHYRRKHIVNNRICPHCLLVHKKKSAIQCTSGRPGRMIDAGIISCFELSNNRACQFALRLPDYHYKRVWDGMNTDHWIWLVPDVICPKCGAAIVEIEVFHSAENSMKMRVCINYFSKKRFCTYVQDESGHA